MTVNDFNIPINRFRDVLTFEYQMSVLEASAYEEILANAEPDNILNILYLETVVGNEKALIS